MTQIQIEEIADKLVRLGVSPAGLFATNPDRLRAAYDKLRSHATARNRFESLMFRAWRGQIMSDVSVCFWTGSVHSRYQYLWKLHLNREHRIAWTTSDWPFDTQFTYALEMTNVSHVEQLLALQAVTMPCLCPCIEVHEAESVRLKGTNIGYPWPNDSGEYMQCGSTFNTQEFWVLGDRLREWEEFAAKAVLPPLIVRPREDASIEPPASKQTFNFFQMAAAGVAFGGVRKDKNETTT